MNILLDTNIIIPLEDTSRVLDTPFAELRKLSAEQKHCLYIHPIQLLDISRDKNEERKNIVKSRLAQYIQIENPPILSEKECTELGLRQANENDKVVIYKKAYDPEGYPFSAVKYSPPKLFIFNTLGSRIVKRYSSQEPLKLQSYASCVASYVV